MDSVLNNMADTSIGCCVGKKARIKGHIANNGSDCCGNNKAISRELSNASNMRVGDNAIRNTSGAMARRVASRPSTTQEAEIKHAREPRY
jgi:hypothetical protein